MARFEASKSNAKDCFAQYQKSGSKALTDSEFSAFLADLFTDYDDAKTVNNEPATTYLFKKFDADHDGELNVQEFERMWDNWAATVLGPKCALLIVDVQNDFISGTLALGNCPAKDDPTRIIPVINTLTDKLPWDVVVYTYDWHPEDHISFYENRMTRPVHRNSKVSAEEAKVMDTVRFAAETWEGGYYEQILWPRHCVQGTWGAQLHPDLKVKPGSQKIYKGTNPDLDSYSAFWDNSKKASTTLDADLRAIGVTDVYVCGLAYDVCVGSTALHALELGYRTVLVEDACSGVTVEGIEGMRSKLRAQHAVVTTSDKVHGMLNAQVRPFELGLKLATAVA